MRWLWVLVIVGCRDKPAQPPPAPAPTPPMPPEQVPADAAEPVTIDLGPGTKTDWYIEAIASDKKHVLLSEQTESRGMHFRVVAIPSNAIETDIELPALSALPRETLRDDGSQRHVKLAIDTPALADELRKIGPVLAQFPLGASSRIAAAPDGKHVAFNAGDWIYTAVDGKVITRVATQASYNPWFTPDGKALLFRRISGTVNGFEGRYELYATSVAGKEPPNRGRYARSRPPSPRSRPASSRSP